jgi:PAS domain S-box-containing protein
LGLAQPTPEHRGRPLSVARDSLRRSQEGQKKLRILLLEDDPLDAELEHGVLVEGGISCEIERVQTRRDFVVALQEGVFDVILADYSLPGFDGLAALEMAREVRPGVPFIIISGTLGEEAAIETLKKGATDYVLKQRLERLVPAVRRAIRESEERSERERALEALRRSEQEFRAMFDLAGIGKAQGDPHTGRFLRVNRKLCEITGYSAEEMLELTFSEITHPEDREKDSEELRRMTRGEYQEWCSEKRYVCKSGVVKWVEVNTALVRDESGRATRIVSTVQDITERKRTEAELARLASFPELNPDPVVEVTAAGEATYLNPSAHEHFPDLATLGRRHPVLEDLPSVSREIEASGGRPFTREIQIDGRFYRQQVVPVPQKDLLRFYTIDATEQLRAQEALRQSEQRFRSLVRYASDMIVLLDADGTIVYESPAVERALGFKPEEGMGSVALSFIHPDDAEAVGGKLTELIGEPGGRAMTEYRVRDKAGAWHHFEAIGVNLLHDPTVCAVVINARDITERRRAEARLRESEERFRLLAENTNDLVGLHELDARYIYVSPSSRRLLGYEPDELLGIDPYDLLHPDDIEQVRKLHGDVFEGRAASKTYRVRKKSGEYVWFETLSEPVFDHEGVVVRMQTSSRDVSDRKRAEQALRQSEQLYRSVVEQSVENIFLVDPGSKRILEANAALQRSLGLTADDLQGVTLYDIVAHDPRSVDENTRRILERKRYFVGERRYRRKDGSHIDVEVNVSVVPYNGKEAMCIVAHDVTRRNRSEEELRNSLSILLALREAGQVLGSTLQSEEIVARLLQIMRGVAGLTAAVIGRTQGDETFRIWRSDGLESLRPRIRYAPEARAARQEALEHRAQRLIRLQSPGYPGDDPLVVLYLPLHIKDRTVGVLEAYGSESLAQSDTAEVLSSLASQAASALENAQLYEELADRERALQDLIGKLLGAQEEERRRVAYEVHDGLAQVAAAAHQHLQSFARRYPPETEAARKDLQRILKLVRGTVSDARRIIANLRPTTLDDLGLVSTISLEVDRLREEGYQVDYETNLGEERLPETLEIPLYRVIQEALTNMRKHAGARRVRVELRCARGEVRLLVSDDGKGFDPAAAALESGPGERMGLVGMHERVGALGGTLEIDSRPGAGTSLVATIPLTHAR